MKLSVSGAAKPEEIAEVIERKVILIDDKRKSELRAHLDHARKIRRDREDERRKNYWR